MGPSALSTSSQGDIELGGMANPPNVAIRRDLDRLEKRSERSLMKFNMGKCKVLPVQGNEPRHEYTLGTTSWKAALQMKLGIPVRVS